MLNLFPLHLQVKNYKQTHKNNITRQTQHPVFPKLYVEQTLRVTDAVQRTKAKPENICSNLSAARLLFSEESVLTEANTSNTATA